MSSVLADDKSDPTVIDVAVADQSSNAGRMLYIGPRGNASI
jgi:hypothetical protein